MTCQNVLVARLVRFPRLTLLAGSSAMILAAIPLGLIRPVSQPTLSFVEFRAGKYERVAVFRVANPSGSSYSFYGERPWSPQYYHRVPTASGFRIESAVSLCTGGCYFEIPAHTSRDFEISAPGATIPPMIGMYFEQGDPAQIERRSATAVGQFWSIIRYWLQRPDPTWSSKEARDALASRARSS